MGSMEPQMHDDQEEVSCKEMLKKLMENESFNDVSLQGTNGARIPANRCALAARSIVFQKMLFGDFSESNKSVVPIGFHSTVIKAVVEYIHTDTSEVLENIKKQGQDKGAAFCPNEIQTVVSLIGAAMFFQFPGLSRKAKSCLSDALETSPSVSFAILEACSKEGSSVPEELRDQALSNIRSGSIVANRGVSVLSAALMEEILQDGEMAVCEHDLFQMLLLWVEGWNATKMSSSIKENRMEDASKMTKHLRLENMTASFLSTVVASSGLVALEELSEAYKQHALAAQHHGVVLNRFRNVPTWNRVRSNRKYAKVSQLDFPPIKRGTYRWTFLVEERGEYLWLGMFEASRWKSFLFTHYVKADKIGMVENNEVMPRRTDLNMLKFGSGSKVTFVLNLTPNDHENGTLSISVDGKPMVQLFSGLQDRLEHINNDGKGYVPLISIEDPARVRLLNIEKA